MPRPIGFPRQTSQLRNELVEALMSISKAADEAARATGGVGRGISNLATIVNSVSGLRLSNIDEAARAMAAFNRELSKLPLNREQYGEELKALQMQFSQYLRETSQFNTKRQLGGQRLQEYNLIERKYNLPTIGFRSPAEDLINRRDVEQRLNVARHNADRTQAVLNEVEAIWTLNERVAERIRQKERNTWFGLTVSGAGRLSLPKDDEQAQARIDAARNRRVYARDLMPGADITDVDEKRKVQDAWFKQQHDVNRQTFSQLGLNDVAITNLTKQLQAFGISSVTVSRPITELSTGITTLSMEMMTAGGAVQRYTTHIDKFGNILNDTQKRFRSFGSAVMRDIVEVLKWTMAITAIYTPIRKMGEMLEEAKKIQLDLVDVQIALGKSSKDMQQVFEASAKIATETSSAIEGVIEGYALAVAASASARTEAERRVATETLLKDSMVLSKLANIEQKESLDMLVGALSQLGLGLTSGSKLLDSWVAVSKKSNVSVNQMAQSFAIVGSAAEEAGLSYHELNALVGTLAQNTTLSANELGNAIRGIIAAMQTDKAQAEFAKYGIATKTVSGDFRDLMDILRQLKVMQQGGILDEKAMGALMQAGGAGARRGAQLSAIVKNLPQAMNLITVSENASGEAAQAMALEMATLDAATTRLNNAFTSLATTLGGEGGVLGTMTTVTDGITMMINGIRELVGIMKWAAPVMGSFMLAGGLLTKTQQGSNLLNRQIGGRLQNLLTSPATMGIIEGTTKQISIKELSGFQRFLQRLNVGTRATGLVQGQTGYQANFEAVGNVPVAFRNEIVRAATWGELGQSIYAFGKKPIFGQQAAGMGLQTNIVSLLGPLVMALSNINKPEGTQRAIAGGIGALPGILAGNPIWSTIGSIIATGFYDKFLTFEGDMVESWTKYAAEAEQLRQANQPPNEEEGPKSREQLMQDLDDLIKNQLNYLDKAQINQQEFFLNFIGKELRGGLFKNLTKEDYGTFPKVGDAEALLSIALSGGKNVFGGKFDISDEILNEVKNLYEQWLEDAAVTTAEQMEMTVFEESAQDYTKEVAQYAASASADMMKKSLEDISKGVSGSIASYASSRTISSQIASAAGYLLATQEKLMTPGMVPGYKPPTEFKPLTEKGAVDFIAGLTDEQRQTVTAFYTELIDYTAKYSALMKDTKDLSIATPEQIAEANDLLTAIQNLSVEFPKLLNAFNQANQAQRGQAKLKDIVELPLGLTSEQKQKVMSEAQRMWEEYLRLSGLTDDEIKAFIATQEEQMIKVGEGLSQLKTKIPQEYITMSLEAQGLTMPSLQDLRGQGITKAMFQSMLTRYRQDVATLMREFPMWRPNEENLAIILKDGFTQASLDWGLMATIMSDLLDETKKQGLQGIYNLPAGATFYVPVTAYEMSKATVTEMAGGGGGALPPTTEETPPMPQSTAREEASQRHREQILEREKRLEGMENRYTTGNPLPVQVTNWAEKGMQEEIPAYRVMREYGLLPEQQTPVEGFKEDVMQTITPPAEEEDYYRRWQLTSRGLMPSPTGDIQTMTLDDVINALKNFGMSLDNWMKGGAFSPTSTLVNPTSPTALVTETPNKSPISTALSLAVDSTIRLVVDGRTLATIIKPYLYEDLLRFSTTTTSTNRSIVA